MRSYFLLPVSAAAIALGAAAVARFRSSRGGNDAADEQSVGNELDGEARVLARSALQWCVIPVWTVAGIADWWCHRITAIEKTTGLETLIQLTMLGEAAVPLIGSLALEVDAPLLGLMIAAFFPHEATAMWDVSYAVTAREVSPIEQHVHSFLEMVPLMGVAFVALLHVPQLKALARVVVEPAHPLIRQKQEPLTGVV